MTKSFHANQRMSLRGILPAILTSMLDSEKNTVRVETNNYYTGLREAFEEKGFTVVDVSQTPDKPYNTIVATLPFGQKDYPELPMLQGYVDSPADRIILVVVNNFLFSNRPKLWEAKRKLLQRNMIEASIMLPQRLMPDSSAPVSILMLDKARTLDEGDWNVNFVDASDLGTKRIKELCAVGDFDAISTLIKDRFSYKQPGCVSKHALDLVVQGASLLASAHCISDSQKMAQQIVDASYHAPLSDVANFFRPLLPSKEKKGEKLYVLNVGQLSQYGYTTPLSEQDGYFERGGKTDPLLRPGDIVLGIRGMLGKVGIIDPNFSTDDLWVASQSCIVLRPTGKDYDARLLFMYLRSEVGQAMIQQIASGASVPMVQISDLKKMHVILPSDEQAVEMLASFEKEVEICKGITELEQQRDAMGKRVWSLDT